MDPPVLVAGVTEASFRGWRGYAADIGVLPEADAATGDPCFNGFTYSTLSGNYFPPLDERVITVRLEGGQVHYTLYASLDAFNSSTPDRSESVPLPEALQSQSVRLVVRILDEDTATIVQKPTASKEADTSEGAAF